MTRNKIHDDKAVEGEGGTFGTEDEKVSSYEFDYFTSDDISEYYDYENSSEDDAIRTKSTLPSYNLTSNI